MTPPIIGVRAWYWDGANVVVRELHGAPTVAGMAGWPTSGLLVVLIYCDEYYAPGLCTRRICMGNDTYWYDPTLAEFGQSDEPVNVVRKRLAPNSPIWTGVTVPDATMQAVADTALASRVAP